MRTFARNVSLCLVSDSILGGRMWVLFCFTFCGRRRAVVPLVDRCIENGTGRFVRDCRGGIRCLLVFAGRSSCLADPRQV